MGGETVWRRLGFRVLGVRVLRCRSWRETCSPRPGSWWRAGSSPDLDGWKLWWGMPSIDRPVVVDTLIGFGGLRFGVWMGLCRLPWWMGVLCYLMSGCILSLDASLHSRLRLYRKYINPELSSSGLWDSPSTKNFCVPLSILQKNGCDINNSRSRVGWHVQ